MKFYIKIKLILAICLIFFASAIYGEKNKDGFELPVKLWAYADVTWLAHCQYHVHLYLEIINDDRKIPLVLKRLTADTWHGTQPATKDTEWYSNRAPITIPPNSKRIVAERSFYVNEKKRAQYWIRWTKFKAETNRGNFESNFVATPFSRSHPEEAPNWIKPAQSTIKLPINEKP